MTVRELEQAIRRILAEAHAPCGEENRISSVDLRANLGEYLDEVDEDLGRSAAAAERVRWALWAMDADDAHPAAIAAARIGPSEVELYAAGADAAAVRPILGETRPDEALRGLQACCGTSLQSVAVARRTFDAWVGYEAPRGGDEE